MAVLVLLAVSAAGCGGGGRATESTAAAEMQDVRGTGFGFSAPAEWQVTRSGRGATARPADGPALASATLIALRKRYQPALFAKTAHELDRVTSALATKLNGKVIARRSLTVDGIRARQYDLAYSRAGSGIVDRITYLLRGKAEYYLLCRWAADEGEPAACGLLTGSFKIR